VTKRSQDTTASETVKTAGVADYIVERIAQEGCHALLWRRRRRLVPGLRRGRPQPKGQMDRLYERIERGVISAFDWPKRF
jgi:hypothetical protein